MDFVDSSSIDPNNQKATGSNVDALRSKFLNIMSNGPRVRSQSVPCDESNVPDKMRPQQGLDSESIDRFRQAQELFKRLEAQALIAERHISDSEYVESDFIEPRSPKSIGQCISPPKQACLRETTTCSQDSLTSSRDVKVSDSPACDDKLVNTLRKSVQFSPMPTTVYETYSSTDYDRRNDTIDPIAASAEYELEKRIEKMDIYRTFITKETVHDSLGFTIIGIGIGADAGIERLGMFIKTVLSPKLSKNGKRIEVGDQIIEVNGVSLVGVTQHFASTFLKQAVGEIELLMGRELDRSDSEILKLINESLEAEQIGWTPDDQRSNLMQDDDSSFCMDDHYVQKVHQAKNDHENQRIRALENEITQLNRQFSLMENIKQRNIILEQQVNSMDRKISEMDQLIHMYGREKKELQAQVIFYQRQCSDLENRYLRAREALLDDLRRRENISNSKSSPIDCNDNDNHTFNFNAGLDRQFPHSTQQTFTQQRIVPINIEIENDSNNYGIDFDSSIQIGEEHSFPLILDDGLPQVNDDLNKREENRSSAPSLNIIEDSLSNLNDYQGSASTSGIGSLVNASKVLITGSSSEQNGESNMMKYFNGDKRPSSAPPDDRIQTSNFLALRIVEWNVDNVIQWLMSNNLSDHVKMFRKMQIDGHRLLKLDSSKLKSLGIKSSKERDYFKAKLKRLKESESSSLTFKLSDAVAAILRPMKRS